MPTGTITNTTKDLNGNVVANVTCVVTLQPPGGFRLTDFTEVAPQVTFTSDASGFWSQALEQTSNISPTGSYYVVQEQYPSSAGGYREYAFTVAAGTTTLFASLLATNPPSPTTNYLTQAQGDARYLSINTAVGNIGINVASAPYNAVADSGTTNNLTPFQSAINASKTGDIIFVPTGTGYYGINTAATGGTALSVTHDLTLYGQDGARTKLKFGPSDTTGTLSGLVLSDGVTLTLVNMDIEGPDTDVHAQIQIGVLAGVAAGQNTSSKIVLRNCTMTKWGQCIKAQGDDTGFTVGHTIWVEDSSLTGNGEGNNILCFGSAAASMVTLRNSTFNQSPAKAVGFSAGQQHNLYLSFPVGLDCDGCTFMDTSGYNIQWNGGPSASPVAVRVSGTRFIGTSTEITGAYLQNNQTVNELTDCSFQMPPLSDCIRSRTTEVHVKGCDFLSGNTSFIVHGGATAGRVIATNCLIQTQVDRQLTGSQWRFTNCTFKNTYTGAAMVAVSNTGGVYVTNSYFNVGNQVSNNHVAASAGTLFVTNCDFNNGGLTTISASGTAIVNVDSCTWDDDTKAITSSTSATSTVRPRQAIGSAITSSSNQIVLPLNSNTFHVVPGSTVTTNLYVQDNTASKNNASFGPYYVIVDSTWSEVTGGNIQVSLTPTNGNLYTHQSDFNKWYHP